MHKTGNIEKLVVRSVVKIIQLLEALYYLGEEFVVLNGVDNDYMAG